MTTKTKSPKAAVIAKMHRYALCVLRAAGVTDIDALAALQQTNAVGRELADEIMREVKGK